MRFAGLAGRFEFISWLPFNRLRLLAGQPAQDEPEPRQLGIAAKIPIGMVLV